MFAGVSSAQAQTAGVCIFDGLSGKLDDGHGHGIQNAQFDASIDIERGSYSFATGGGVGAIEAVCAGVFAGEPEVDINAEISSNGFYDNIICGTGFAHDLDGSGTVIGGTTESVPPVLDSNTISISGAGYEIPFVAGNGPLLIGPNGKPALAALTEQNPPFAPDTHAPTHGPDGAPGTGPPSGMHGDVVSAFTGVGAVHITPRAPDNCVNAAAEADGFNDTDEFLVSGFFVATDLP
jgi:hypothetical protein